MSDKKNENLNISLNEYLSSLVASINYSRMNADLESLKIAKIYGEDEYMKNFSIPRMKIKDVTMDIPVAIKDFNITNNQKENKKNDVDNYAVMSSIYNDMKNFYEVDHFPEKLSYKIRKIIFEKISEAEDRILSGEKYEDFSEVFAKDLSKNISLSVNEDSDGVKIEKNKIEKLELRKSTTEKQENVNIKIKKTTNNKNETPKIEDYLNDFLKNSLLQNFLLEKRDGKIGYISVLAQSHQIKELPIESLVKIKLTIEEESIEWNIDGDDTTKKKLLPE